MRHYFSLSFFLQNVFLLLQFQAFDFRRTTRNEPFLQPFHCLYVYPVTVSLSRKRNLFIRVELRKDDGDVRKQPLEVKWCSSSKSVYLLDLIVQVSDIWSIFYQAMHSREPGASLQKCAHTQVAVGARIACYHDEIKVSLPAIWTPQHHLLFTFFHVDLQTKLEAPKPVSWMMLVALKTDYTCPPFIVVPHFTVLCATYSFFHCFANNSCFYSVQVVIGYASLPLSTHAQYVIQHKLLFLFLNTFYVSTFKLSFPFVICKISWISYCCSLSMMSLLLSLYWVSNVNEIASVRETCNNTDHIS